jgi:N-acetylglucosaminyldiphosphoundecaprenol N-acetyl-beta-D-mannosaminyltransferase
VGAASVAVADRAVAAADSASLVADRLELLGIPVDTMQRSDIERRIVARLADPRPGILHIATINPEYVVAAHRDPVFRNALSRSEIAVPDGVGIVAAVRALCSRNINAASIAELQGRYPTRIVGRWGSGTAAPTDDRESVERLRERSANVVLVGYGAPGQVIWIERNREALASAGVKVAIGVGGALDYVSGSVERAPRFVRRLGCEWLYRLVQEPWRWRRQLALPRFGAMVARAGVMRRGPGGVCPCRILALDETAHQNDNR